LSGLALKKANLEGANLRKIKFRGLDLREANGMRDLLTLLTLRLQWLVVNQDEYGRFCTMPPREKPMKK
jgi:hypothetical protein